MDRHDEAIERDTHETDDRTEARTGDVLGLGGSPIPKEPGDPSASNDPKSVAQRRERAFGGEDKPLAPHEDPYKQHHGATGIDMGSGGQGTDLSGE